ncbi:ABC-type glycerol-3-phosphate transport system permease component [Bradyrhizobium liaoningense]
MIGDRWSRTFALGLIGVASFSSLLPIVLAVMNALKTTVEIGSNPLALPTQLHWENFSSALAQRPARPEPAAQRRSRDPHHRNGLRHRNALRLCAGAAEG